MHPLDQSYGKNTFSIWYSKRPRDLTDTQTNPTVASQDAWHVTSFNELLNCVAFLGAMNKRMTLFYRGQSRDYEPVPTIFRKSWRCFQTGQQMEITGENRMGYWQELPRIGREVYMICDTEKLGLPRWRALHDIREVQWSIVQHYGLWPTPLIDLTSSLRTAASFAMDLRSGTEAVPVVGYVYVVGMPHSTGSISVSVDENLVLARLQSACPPIAKRPHYQEGFLVGRFPLYEAESDSGVKSSLLRRLVAKFVLRDEGTFWNRSFPLMEKHALLPDDDLLLKDLISKFGLAGDYCLPQKAQQIRLHP